MKSVLRNLVTPCVAVLAVATVWVTSTPGEARKEAGQVSPAAEGSPNYAVEYFDYPQADRIYQETGILLKRGDGHITLVDCATTANVLEVSARGNADPACFRVTGDGGYLTLEMESVYGILGNDYTTEVDMTVGDEKKSFDITKNAWTPVGETSDPEGRDHMLVEIRSTR